MSYIVDVNYVYPEQKDFDRVINFNGGRLAGDASKMAKSITDLAKLVRRSKALVDVWRGYPQFDEVWKPFKDALKNAGFSDREIQVIAEYDSGTKRTPKAFSGTMGTVRKQVPTVSSTPNKPENKDPNRNIYNDTEW